MVAVDPVIVVVVVGVLVDLTVYVARLVDVRVDVGTLRRLVLPT